MRFALLCFAIFLAVSGCKNEEKTEQPSGAVSVEELPWTFLTDGILQNTGTFAGRTDVQGNPNEGHWIDFKPDGTFDYGEYDKKSYQGQYRYDPEKTLLTLIPDNGAAPMSEWMIKWTDDRVVFLGTSTYQNNNMQMRWERSQELPVK